MRLFYGLIFLVNIQKEFNRLIEIFRSNLQLTGNEEVIKCFCGKACE